MWAARDGGFFYYYFLLGLGFGGGRRVWFDGWTRDWVRCGTVEFRVDRVYGGGALPY